MAKLMYHGLAALSLAASVAYVNAGVCDYPVSDYLTNGGPQFTWWRLRTRESSGSSTHPTLYTDGEFASWKNGGVSKAHEKDLTFSVLNQPAKANVKYIAFFVAGQQGGDGLGNYSGWFENVTGSFQDWNSNSNFPYNQLSVTRGLDSKSGAYRFYTESGLGKIFPREETLIIAVFDAAFYYLDGGNEKSDILDGWRHYLENKVVWNNIKGLYGHGFSRGGCFVARFYDKLISEKPVLETNAKLILETLDPVCKPTEWNINVASADQNMDNPANAGNYFTFASKLGNLFSGMSKDNIRWKSYIGGNSVAAIAHAYSHAQGTFIGSASWPKISATQGSTSVSYSATSAPHLNPSAGDMLYTTSGALIGTVSSVTASSMTLTAGALVSHNGGYSINGQSTDNGINWSFKTPAGNVWYQQTWVDEDHCSIGEANPNPFDFINAQLAHAQAAATEFGLQKFNLPPTYSAWSACTPRPNACGGYLYRLKSWTANGVPKTEQETQECFLASNPCVFSDWVGDNYQCQTNASGKKVSTTKSTCNAWPKGASFTGKYENGKVSASTSGSITTSATSATYTTKSGVIGSGFPVTGASTSFTSQAAVGDYIGTATGVIGKISFIESATKLYLTAAPLIAASGASFAVRKACDGNGQAKAYATPVPYCAWNPTANGASYVCNLVPAAGTSSYLFDEDRNLHAQGQPVGLNVWIDGAQPGVISGVSSTPTTLPDGSVGYAVTGTNTVFKTFYPVGYQPGDKVYVGSQLIGTVQSVANDSLLYLQAPPTAAGANLSAPFYKFGATSTVSSAAIIAGADSELQAYADAGTTTVVATPPPGPSGSGVVSFNPNCKDASAQLASGVLTKCATCNA